MPIALVTTSIPALRETDIDLAPLTNALARREIDVEVVPWDGGGVRWSNYQFVIMRSPWDYSDRADEFLAWLADVSATTQLLNCPHTIRWNIDKRYLQDLLQAGVRVVPTQYATSSAQLESVLASQTGTIVVKPSVSAGSRDTGLFEADDPVALKLGRRIIGQGKTAMVQPAIPTVATAGESALLFFDESYSHAVRKGPLLALGGGLRGGEYREALEVITSPEGHVEIAARTISAARAAVAAECDCPDGRLLYARIDIVVADGEPMVLEAELFEPSYFTPLVPAAAERFASVVAQRLDAAANR